MKNYNREVRPVVNASTPVVVHVGITLTQIFDMVTVRGQCYDLKIFSPKNWENIDYVKSLIFRH
jgi:hypothetical protein